MHVPQGSVKGVRGESSPSASMPPPQAWGQRRSALPSFPSQGALWFGYNPFPSHLRHVLARKQGETGHRALLSMLFAELVPKVLTRDDELAKARPLPGSPSARFPSCCGHGVFEAPHPCRAWALASRPAPGLRDIAQGLGVRLASPLPSMCSRGRGSVPCRVGTHGPLTGRDGGNARCTE